MRAIITDDVDGMKRVVAVNEMGYDLESKVLWISTPDNDFEIANMDKVMADIHMRNLYNDGRVDLSEYMASTIE